MTLTVAPLADAARHAPATPFAIGEDASLTFAEVHRQAGRFATAARSWGVAPGDPVALVLPNAPAMVVDLYGTLMAGAVPMMRSSDAAPTCRWVHADDLGAALAGADGEGDRAALDQVTP